MDRAQITSNSIASIGYDPDIHVLEIEFHNGAVYRYSLVSEKIHRQLMKSDAKTTYFNTQIRPVYPCKRIK